MSEHHAVYCPHCGENHTTRRYVTLSLFLWGIIAFFIPVIGWILEIILIILGIVSAFKKGKAFYCKSCKQFFRYTKDEINTKIKEQVNFQPTESIQTENTTEKKVVDSITKEMKEDIVESILQSSIKIEYNREKNINKKLATTPLYQKANFIPNEYVVFDFETTGLDPKQDRIIQIGAIRYCNHEEVNTFEGYVNPGIKISPKITKITGITNDDVKDAPYIEDILPKFLDFIGDTVLVAHNASFDMKFLLSNISTCSLSFQNNLVIDTLSLSRKYIKDTENHKLETLKKYLLIDELSHHALSDCKVCAAVFQKCIDIRNEKNRLDGKESECLQLVTNILKENNRDVSLIRHSHVGNYFDIAAFSTVARLKLNGKKQYLVTKTPLEDIEKRYPQANCGPTTQSGTGQTRIYINNIKELVNYKELFIEGYDQAIEDQKHYAENVSKGTRVLEEYYSL